MDKKAGTGELSCKVCGQSFQTGINCQSQQLIVADTVHFLLERDLSAAVDVYSDWIDACDTVAKEAADSEKIDAASSYADLDAGAGGRRNSDMQIDRHLVDVVDDDGAAAYADN
ncbi:MAG: hypothetical protein M1830_003382 [Pleopsidium flavum]|nr:MAG: hypothetical protein M1830_003382 [Pleopsidium flavum]